LAKLAGPLYAKLRKNSHKYFNSEDIKLVKIIKDKIKDLKPLELPLNNHYLIIETDASKEGWGAILKKNLISTHQNQKKRFVDMLQEAIS
jgi:hypothetical protein